jgi:hypothetical protein
MTPIDELKIFSGATGSFSEAVKILSMASLKEISLVLDKINYYLEHVNVISSSQSLLKNRQEIRTKKEFLENMQKILIEELQRRNHITKVN